jgi:hypothetical protein
MEVEMKEGVGMTLGSFNPGALVRRAAEN